MPKDMGNNWHPEEESVVACSPLVGILLGIVVSGNVILETIFFIPGIGLWVVNAIGESDYPIIQGVVLVVAAALVFINLLVDITYGWLDPRIRYA